MKKRITSILVVLSMALSLMPFFALPASAVTAVAPLNSADSDAGSAANPYKIATPGNLVWFRDKINDRTIPNTSCANLTADIDLNNESWTPINEFRGTLDGRNHKILNTTREIFELLNQAVMRNTHIVNTSTFTNSAGLGIISNGATNVTFINCSVNTNVSVDKPYFGFGGFVGYSETSTFEDCYMSGLIKNTSDTGEEVSAFAAKSRGVTKFKRCWSDAVLTSYYDVGGFIGESVAADIEFENCYFAGSTTDVSDDGRSGAYLGWAHSSSSARFTNCHSYSNKIWIGDFRLADYTATYTNARLLGNGGGDASKVLGLTESQYASATNFGGWDFSKVWELTNGKYPTLQQRVDASSKSRTLEYYNDANGEFNLPDYFDLILAEDKNYNQDHRFTYTLPTNSAGTVSVFNPVTMEYEDETITLASIDTNDTDKLVLNKDMPLGTYTITVNAHDETGAYEDFQFDLTVTVKEKVPAPQVLASNLSYTRGLLLGMIPITGGWQWVSPAICPKDTNTEGYDVFYQFEDGKAAYYDYSAIPGAVYDAEKNGITVKLPVNVARSDESPWGMYITVKNADTGEVIPNATVTCDYDDEFPNGNLTAATGEHKGQVYAELSPGKRTLHVSATGFTDEDGKTTEAVKNETVTILASDANAPVAELVPVRTEVTFPTVIDAETKERIPSDLVSITKLSTNKTDAWNGKSDSYADSGAAAAYLPDGRYMFKNATYGYSTENTLFIKVENNTYAYYTDSECTVPVTDHENESKIEATKLTDPRYDLLVKKESDTTYTATVSLSNVKATMGAFALRWDTDIFTLRDDGININTANVKGGIQTAEDIYAEDYGKAWNKNDGYYAFEWFAGGLSDEGLELDAELTTKHIATFTFDIDQTKTNLLTVDSFGIQLWDETKPARAYKANLAAGEEDLFDEYWREVDKDNNINSLKPYRLAASKSVVNGVETGGFFQARLSGDLSDEAGSHSQDIMTVLTYEPPIKNSVIRFHVYDKDTEDGIYDATVRLFDAPSVKMYESKETDEVGRANFSVNTWGVSDTNFAYDVAKYGYWPLPLSGLLSDRPVITTETGKATNVEVPLEKKIYHKPVLSHMNEQQLEIIRNADIGGEKYAYNNRDYHFRIKGAKGYRIVEYPTYALVTIGDKVIEQRIDPDDSGLFTVPAEILNQAPFTYDELTTLKATEGSGYEDWSGAQPDSDGYRSYNVVVQFDHFKVEEIEYIVEGSTNAGGTVTYDPSVPFADGRPAEVAENDYVRVRTQKEIKDQTTGTIEQERNQKTGTFTFAANDGYVIERVYINGLQINTYNDTKGFTYSFGEVDMDNSIVVLFYDGNTPSTDKLLTLVVGDFGFADVDKPVEEKGDNGVMFSRRVYLNPQTNLEFSTHTINDEVYELYKVEKETVSANQTVSERIDITQSAVGGSYSIASEEAKNVVVYVTFRNKSAETNITPTLFVKSYVYEGQGVMDPCGILIYNKYDSPEFTLKPDTDGSWLAKGVMLSPFENLDITEENDTLSAENVFRYDSLTESIGVGAIFVEKGYKVQGLVDLGQASGLTTDAPRAGATVTFVRLENGAEKAKQVPYVTTTNAKRNNAVFNIDLPAGDWNVYVTKPGLATYKLTNYHLDKPADDDTITYFGGSQDRVVVPYIGSTVNGKTISLQDAANVKSGWRDNVNAVVKNMANVDDDEAGVTYRDLVYVIKNYNKRQITQEYSDFADNGSKSVKQITYP